MKRLVPEFRRALAERRAEDAPVPDEEFSQRRDGQKASRETAGSPLTEGPPQPDDGGVEGEAKESEE